MLAVGLSRDRPIEAAALAMDDALLRVDNLADLEQLRIVADHLRRDIEHQRRLFAVSRGRVNLCADLAVEQQEVDRQRRADFALAVLARQHEQARPILPQAVLAGREQRSDDLVLLPLPQLEQLTGERAAGVTQPVDQSDGAIGGCFGLHPSSPAHFDRTFVASGCFCTRALDEGVIPNSISIALTCRNDFSAILT